MRKLVLLFMAVLSCSIYASAQSKKVSGTVTSTEGKPIAGVTVVVDGTHVGTSTNADGQYTLDVRKGETLQFSFIGMQTQTIAINDRTTIDVVMQDDAIGLDNVVITALGLTRQERTLGYASSTVRADEIAKGRAADAMSGLIGKVAGMQISSSGGTGTSQKVIVRGYSSLTGSNQPLYVVDGVPISNSTMGTQDLDNSIDFGNQAADVNPDEIESITVLKGASATALYGSRAGNGVIIITTKRGRQNEDVTVTYDGSFMASTVLRIPQLQDQFGQGWYYDYEGGYFGNFSPTENGSWGNRLDGRPNYWRPGAAWYDGAEMSVKPFSYAKNSLKNFYDVGFETNNTITVQGGTETSGFMASYGNTYSNGILPGNNDYYKRNTISFRGNTQIKGGLAWLNYGISYVRKDVRNAMTGQGGSGSTIYQDILQYPVDIDYGDLKDYDNIYNNANNFYTPYAQNPWWTLDHNYSTYQDDRVYGNIELGFQLLKGLQLIGRLGGDFDNSTEKYYNDLWTFDPGSYTAVEGGSTEQGSYQEIARRSNQIDANILLNADYRFGRDWSLHAAAGWNLNQRTASYVAGSLTGLAVEEWPSFDNTSGAIPTSSSYFERRRLLGLYGQADLGWRDAIYLTLSARNDWSSTLPIDDNSFFYWGANVSVVLTDLFPSIRGNVLSFLKLRGGYGQTGNDASPYYTSTYYVLGSATGGFGSLTFPLNSFSGLLQSTRMPATSLRPEISTEWEVGADIRLFQNRVNFDIAYYNKKTRDQIISADLAPESGYTSQVRNVGLIQNRGIELTVGLVPVRTKDWEWDFTYTFSKNKNEVKELWDDVTETTIYGLTTGPQLKAIVGQPLGTWTYYKTETVQDESSPYYGKTIVNASTGYPVLSSTETEIIGYADPKFTMGFNNTVRWKNLSLGFSFDWRYGGKMYSATKSIVYFNGNAEETLYNMRDSFVVPNAVYVGEDGEYHENNIPITAYNTLNNYWYSNSNNERYRDDLLDKTYLKLREINLTYRLPRKWFAGVKWLTGIDVSLVGRNLLMWTPTQGLIDPDMTNYGNDLTSQFGEFYSAPTTRTFGGSIKIIF